MRLATLLLALLLPALAQAQPGGPDPVATLTPSAREDGAGFGRTLDLGAGRAIVGAPGESSGGAAYVFVRRADGTWDEEARLAPPDPDPGDFYGARVAIDGDDAVVGAIGRGARGAAFLYRRSAAGVWELEAEVEPTASVVERFGRAVDIDAGRAVVSGSPDRAGIDVFARTDSGGWVHETRISDPGTDGPDGFGAPLALDGDRLLVGARDYLDEQGVAYVLARDASGVWVPEARFRDRFGFDYDQYGSSVALSGGVALVGAPRLRDRPIPGKADVWERDEMGDWVLTDTLGFAAGRAGDRFGRILAFDGVTAVVASTERAVLQTFERSADGVWTRSDRTEYRGYGALAIEGATVLIGEATAAGGEVHVLELGDAGADPYPTASYYPLGLGDTWHYVLDQFTMPPVYSRVAVVGDSTIGETPYRVRRTETYAPREPAGTGFRLLSVSDDLVRFDAAGARVVQGFPATGAEQALHPCRLDLPLAGGDPVPCGSGDAAGLFLGDRDIEVAVGDASVTTNVRTLSNAGGGAVYAAGLGVASEFYEASDAELRLLYAAVDGAGVGTPIDGLPVYDPTPPATYFPLAVGNAWEYAEDICVQGPLPGCEPLRTIRLELVGDSTVDGTRYLVEERRVLEGRPFGQDPPPRLLRFDTATASVVSPDGPITCPLDLPFGAFGCPAAVYGTDDVRTNGIPGLAEKQFEVGFCYSETFTSGLGLTSSGGSAGSLTLTYARIDGETAFGSPFVVAGEPGATPLGIEARAFPNPTAAGATLALVVPDAGRVRVEVFDALGRRVWRDARDRAAGRSTLALPSGRWAPGTYAVRVTAGGATATARLVRQ